MDIFLYESMALTENHELKIIILCLVDYLVSIVNYRNLLRAQHPAPFVFSI